MYPKESLHEKSWSSANALPKPYPNSLLTNKTF